MTLRLLSMSIEPGPTGLALPEVKFGQFLTHVFGDNGAGKTALMCALYWSLGGARQVEDPIWSECAGVRLKLIAASGKKVTIFRAFSDKLNATVDIDGAATKYDDESSWSAALLPILGVEAREWLAKSGVVTGVYTSVLLPAFAVDQDKGWSLPYAPFSSKQFVEDQAQEVTRLLLGLPQMNNPKRDARRRKLAAELARLDAAISMHGQALDSLSKALPAEHQFIDAMREARERLVAELGQFDSVVATMVDVDATLRQRVLDAVAARDAAAREYSGARQRRAILDKLMQEGTADLDLIGTNEVAADAFRRFCGNPSCQFFAGTAEPNSYGRRVLYLRDQFKDITTAMDAVDGVLAVSAARLVDAEALLGRARAEYDAAAKAKASDRVIAAVDAVTKELASVSRNIALSDQVVREQEARNALLAQRETSQTDLAQHDDADTRRRKSVAGTAKKLAAAANRWLAVLKANEGGAVGVDEELRLTVGGKPLSDTKGPSGSSRLRLILAYHAAILEVALEMNGSHPRLLLFDAPKQHELKPDDFAAYLVELRRVFAGKSVQVVISSRTEIPKEAGDETWEPQFPGKDHPWFLGKESTKKEVEA